jgi:DNA-binding transcriptional ArsR family regulator
MSPHNTNTTCTTWDPSRLRLDPDQATQLNGQNRRGRRAPPILGKFIAGPLDVPWLIRASRLGVKALLVGLALWYLRGLRRSDSFIVSNLMLQEWGIEADAKSRGLRALEKAGLITVQRRGKRSPRVRLNLRFDTGIAQDGNVGHVAADCPQ